MADSSVIGFIAVFAAGLVSFLSPCVLPLVPGYVSYVAGRRLALGGASDPGSAKLGGRPVPLALIFVTGFATVFIGFGVGATAIGSLLLSYRYELNLVGGAVVILFGLSMTGTASLSLLQRDYRFRVDLPGGRPASAYILGLAFGFGWTPCIGPVLGAILTASAATATVGQGAAMLAVYAAGLGVPFVAAAVFTDGFTRKLRAMGRLSRVLQPVAGLAMIAMGVAMITGSLSGFSYWLIDSFPVLGRLG